MTFEDNRSLSDSPGGSFRTITAFFDTREDAQEAIGALHAEGVKAADIELIEGNRDDGVESGYAERPYHQEGFWASLANLFMPEEDRYTYAEGLRRGGYLVTVRARGSDYDTVVAILDQEGTVDLEDRSENWRSSGWRLPDTAAPGASVAERATTPTASTTKADIRGDDRNLDAGREEVVPIAEERLRVGKREVDQGRVRVRSYVVETPVEENVQLREERVHVERRPADRAVSGTADPFQERVIELEERGEEAVVSKDARITEEVVVGKEDAFRTEKISDTVRRTKIEVEDERQPKQTGVADAQRRQDVSSRKTR